MILAAAAYRLWHLLAEDKITEPWRVQLTDEQLDFVECPWCLGFWVSAAVYGSWRLAPRTTMTSAVPLALSAAVGRIAK